MMLHNESEIVKIIDTRRVYLKQHFQYLSAIEKNEISNEEILEYLSDVFDFVKIEEKEVKDVLVELKQTLLNKMLVYRHFNEACLLSDKSMRFSLLRLYLEYELIISSTLSGFQKSGMTKKWKIQTVFHDHPTLKLLNKMLEPYIPPSHKLLSSVIRMRQEQGVKYIELEHSTVYETTPYVDINWRPVLLIFRSYPNLSIHQNPQRGSSVPHRKNYQKGKKNESLANLKTSLQLFSDTGNTSLTKDEQEKTKVVEAMIIVGEEMEKNESQKVSTTNEIYNLIKDNVMSYYRILPVLEMVEEITGKVEIESKENKNREKAVKFYQGIRKHLREKTDALRIVLDSIYDRLIVIEGHEWDSAEQNIFSSLETSLSDIATLFEEVDDILPNDCPTTIKSKSDIHDLRSTVDEKIENIRVNLESCKKMTSNLEQTLAENLVKNKTNNNAPNDILQENEEFKARQREAIKHYKEQVQQRREDKKSMQRSHPDNNNNNNNNTVVYRKNIMMEDRLRSLSSRNMSLLKSILSLEPGIKFNDVKLLVTEHLGGTVSEIGNGSSHKRIEIERLYVEIVTHGEKNNSETVVDTLHKPHHSGHCSGKLSRFNLKLLRDTFSRAKIDLESIKQLENSSDENDTCLVKNL